MSELPPTNLLQDAASPYLQQHAHNPVHWRPWSAAALDEARATGRPILLSVGYAACHWCHVMAHESFEDPETAALMNRLFVNIKVDREERPDLDHVYMTALHALGEQGGWPLTMFLTPDGAPFWGGTYFPPEPRWGRPSFRQVLTGVRAAYDRDQDKVAHNAAALSAHLTRLPQAAASTPTPSLLADAADTLLRLTDPVEGGLKGAPKFPNAPIFRFLWAEGIRRQDARFHSIVRMTLHRMACGGIFDHLGGGFARYSVDGRWLVPHFEKMLYDNAQLLELLAFAHAAKPDPVLARRATKTVDWLMQEMLVTDPPGAFASALDADSEGEEGKFYVWRSDEVRRVLTAAGLGDRFDAFADAYDVTATGNWEGLTILHRPIRSDGDPAGAVATEDALEPCRAVLKQCRDRRERPIRDDKVLADWNGLLIVALTRAGQAFDRPDWTAAAETAAEQILARLRTPDGRLAHAYRGGTVAAQGLVEDYAFMALGLLALHQATGRPDRLSEAIALLEQVDSIFGDGDGGVFHAAADAVDVPFRARPPADNAVPSGTSRLAEAYAIMFNLTGNSAWRERATRLIGRQLPADSAAAFPGLLQAASLLDGATTLVVAGSDHDAAPLLALARRAPDPHTIVVRLRPGDTLPPGHPACGKPGHAAAVYLCRGGTCELPITSADELAQRLAIPP
jgi:hypothetical protein